MKPRLTKALLLTLLAAGTYQAEAARNDASIGVDSHTYTESKAFDTTNASKDALTPYTKDGSGTASISASTDLTLALYVREGKVVMGNGANAAPITVTLTPTLPSSISYYATGAGTSFAVAGKGAVVELDNATLKSKVATSMTIGSPSGNGTLVVSNGSLVDNHTSGGINFFIGAASESTNHYNAHIHATKTGNSWRDPNYSGDYETLSDNTKIGAGYVTVKENSKIFGGYNGLALGEGSLDIEGGSSVYAGFDAGALNANGVPSIACGQADNFESSIGAIAGASAVVNVKDNSIFSTGVGLKIGAFDNTDVTINVEKGSLFEVADRSSGAGKAFIGTEFKVTGSKLLGFDRTWEETGAANTTVNINASDASTLKFNALQIGSSKEKAGEININILDKGSRMESASMTMYDGTITNAGTLSAKGAISLNGGKLSLEGGTVESTSLTIGAGAELAAIAPTNMEATVTMTLEEAAVLNTQTVANVDSALTFEQGAILTLQNGSIDMNGNALTLGSGLVLNLTCEGFTLGDTVLLFSNVGSCDLDDTNVTLASDVFTTTPGFIGYGAELVYDSTNRTVSLKTIPEPTTATLSLLALAALASRRRRR